MGAQPSDLSGEGRSTLAVYHGTTNNMTRDYWSQAQRILRGQIEQVERAEAGDLQRLHVQTLRGVLEDTERALAETRRPPSAYRNQLCHRVRACAMHWDENEEVDDPVRYWIKAALWYQERLEECRVYVHDQVQQLTAGAPTDRSEAELLLLDLWCSRQLLSVRHALV